MYTIDNDLLFNDLGVSEFSRYYNMKFLISSLTFSISLGMLVYLISSSNELYFGLISAILSFLMLAIIYFMVI